MALPIAGRLNYKSINQSIVMVYVQFKRYMFLVDNLDGIPCKETVIHAWNELIISLSYNI